MKKTAIHATAGTLAVALVLTLWTSTLISELFLGSSAVTLVKHHIAHHGLACLVLAMAATGGTGFAMGRARTGRLVDEKKKRMPVIGANGLFVMIPCALFLNTKAAAGEFDAVFYAVQALELAVGAFQLALLFKNMRAGLRLSGRLRATPKNA